MAEEIALCPVCGGDIDGPYLTSGYGDRVCSVVCAYGSGWAGRVITVDHHAPGAACESCGRGGAAMTVTLDEEIATQLKRAREIVVCSATCALDIGLRIGRKIRQLGLDFAADVNVR